MASKTLTPSPRRSTRLAAKNTHVLPVAPILPPASVSPAISYKFHSSHDIANYKLLCAGYVADIHNLLDASYILQRFGPTSHSSFIQLNLEIFSYALPLLDIIRYDLRAFKCLLKSASRLLDTLPTPLTHQELLLHDLLLNFSRIRYY